MITTTLNAIREHSPCTSGWKKLLAHLGKTEADDEELPLLTILESSGLDDTLWCLRVLGPEHDGWMWQYVVWCARQVQHLMSDPRSLAALDVAERYANGNATDEELSAARSAAADGAWSAARSANMTNAATVARSAAANAARLAAAQSATDAAWSAANAARLAAAQSATDAAWSAARSAQTARLRELLL